MIPLSLQLYFKVIIKTTTTSPLSNKKNIFSKKMKAQGNNYPYPHTYLKLDIPRP